MSLDFQWDPRKAAVNRRKHGVTFEEAIPVFEDPLARIFLDEWHSDTESREIIVGYSGAGNLLLVAFAEQSDATVRLISARHATPKEQHDYEQRSRS
jgi:uncharacterized DUF497 family protein